MPTLPLISKKFADKVVPIPILPEAVTLVLAMPPKDPALSYCNWEGEPPGVPPPEEGRVVAGIQVPTPTELPTIT